MKNSIKAELAAEGISVLFFALVVVAANGLHLFFILFPEMGALASDVLIRPGGKWAREPWKLVCTPPVGAAIGVAVTHLLSYGAGAILLTMSLCILLILGMRSAVAPAISAGVLAVALGISSWLYPLCILGSIGALTALLLVWRQTPYGRSLLPRGGIDRRTIDVLESKPKAKWWFPSLVLFVAALGTAAQLTGWRFILFPPLIVMAYEMLGHTEVCPWAKQPFIFPAVCTVAAFLGYEAVTLMGVNPLATSMVLVLTFAMLRAARLRMPPALAVGLIPFVISHPSLKYPLSVAIGTVALTLWFLMHRVVVTRLVVHR